jgi:hypothetical protein
VLGGTVLGGGGGGVIDGVPVAGGAADQAPVCVTGIGCSGAPFAAAPLAAVPFACGDAGTCVLT